MRSIEYTLVRDTRRELQCKLSMATLLVGLSGRLVSRRNWFHELQRSSTSDVNSLPLSY